MFIRIRAEVPDSDFASVVRHRKTVAPWTERDRANRLGHAPQIDFLQPDTIGLELMKSYPLRVRMPSASNVPRNNSRPQ